MTQPTLIKHEQGLLKVQKLKTVIKHLPISCSFQKAQIEEDEEQIEPKLHYRITTSRFPFIFFKESIHSKPWNSSYNLKENEDASFN